MVSGALFATLKEAGRGIEPRATAFARRGPFVQLGSRPNEWPMPVARAWAFSCVLAMIP